MRTVISWMSLRNQSSSTPMVAMMLTTVMGDAPCRNCVKVNPAFVPMKMPTGLPSIVVGEPMLVQSTPIRTKGVGRSFSVSQT